MSEVKLTLLQSQTLNACMTRQQTARQIAERQGHDMSLGMTTHWIRPHLDALVKKGMLTKEYDTKARVNLYKTTAKTRAHYRAIGQQNGGTNV